VLEHFPEFVSSKVCLSCEGCCRYKNPESIWRPKISQDEIIHVKAKRSSLVDKIFSKDNIERKGFLKTAKMKSRCRCTFFNVEQNTCNIYADRPFECQLYPFLLNKKGKEYIISVHLACPDVQKRRYSSDFENYTISLKQFFQRPSVREFFKKNLTLFVNYNEYADEIEDVFSFEL
jgi:Fe-S-cluster containining protein